MEISQSVALITGASSGIGKATALVMAEKGARLVLAARNGAALASLADEIASQGGQALPHPADVVQIEQVQALASAALEKWGRIDILIANAGQYLRCPVKEASPTIFRDSLEVNFLGAVNCIQAVLPHMLANRKGHIVLVSSMDGKKGLPLDAPYVAAKFALNGLGDVLRQELHGTGVHCSVICPGRVDTPMIAELRVPRISAKIPPTAVAKAIVKAIQKGTPEVIIPFQARLLHWLNFLSPGLADYSIRLLRLQGW